ncbi:bacteriohemerythrin [Campylobacter sp. RM16704]|uniref:bacteriohemerythrin n=1 Tax=Campylobacter sp. RM16704 TaxID=1500960 RepID=UPI00057E4031|nr:hemerythrin-like metal-binding domain protein [Campylobacter sp. RM16704]AJC86611.1 hemerythrin-like metal-binding domain protein [Campylobacter sp. RM16704]
MLSWKEEYSVHNKTIDEQHKALFEIAKKIYFMTENHVKLQKIKSISAELFKCVKIHFRDEEDYMEKIGYPDLAHHKKVHKEIVSFLIILFKHSRTVNEFKERFNIFIEKWLLGHILYEDQKYREYVKQKLREKEYTFEEDDISTEPIFEEFAPKYVVYVCGCINKRKIPYRLHQQILNGVKYNCKFCKKIIHPEREF